MMSWIRKVGRVVRIVLETVAWIALAACAFAVVSLCLLVGC